MFCRDFQIRPPDFPEIVQGFNGIVLSSTVPFSFNSITVIVFPVLLPKKNISAANRNSEPYLFPPSVGCGCAPVQHNQTFQTILPESDPSRQPAVLLHHIVLPRLRLVGQNHISILFINQILFQCNPNCIRCTHYFFRTLRQA